jgi:hypothetical protein
MRFQKSVIFETEILFRNKLRIILLFQKSVISNTEVLFCDILCDKLRIILRFLKAVIFCAINRELFCDFQDL